MAGHVHFNFPLNSFLNEYSKVEGVSIILSNLTWLCLILFTSSNHHNWSAILFLFIVSVSEHLMCINCVKVHLEN